MLTKCTIRHSQVLSPSIAQTSNLRGCVQQLNEWRTINILFSMPDNMHSHEEMNRPELVYTLPSSPLSSLRCGPEIFVSHQRRTYTGIRATGELLQLVKRQLSGHGHGHSLPSSHLWRGEPNRNPVTKRIKRPSRFVDLQDTHSEHFSDGLHENEFSSVCRPLWL
jgi:hypothetical protein